MCSWPSYLHVQPDGAEDGLVELCPLNCVIYLLMAVTSLRTARWGRRRVAEMLVALCPPLVGGGFLQLQVVLFGFFFYVVCGVNELTYLLVV